jgi:hypothetical protein
VTYRQTWRKESDPELPGVFYLYRFGTRVGELRLDDPSVRIFAESLAQDVVVVLNAPEIIDAWLASRRREVP